ncbi:MAG: cytochrome c4 [Alphaproteobacteria bacterium]|nr:cytochrome c4 [Alphaproteobacteria bacterium]MDE1986274.1 cytochrome c4 [Alphaproteobacteria bacterium]MDE2162708.1 cytochrome c4 [Alphaproteobacteria bacterium]MDE2266654.1 cytochrome c4 [Alphaproteobacteria bacterium]MDE2499616.1 cytochrome c4 [Alphaproteobacteria bacterium]
MKIVFVVTLATCASVASTLAMAEGSSTIPPAAVAEATSVCQDCHGPQGNSVSSTFPRLNGQQADYIEAQLKNFRDHSRSDPHARAYMWGMASQLDDATIAGLAKYYSGQTPTQPQKGGALAAEGKNIFMNGVEAQNVPACQACHGEHGEGNSVIPRIAGQHANYLKTQLEAFRSTLRESDVMHANTKDMTDSQIEALVSYLAND